MYIFPRATQELLILLNENKDDPGSAIDKYLQDFGMQCAQKFLTSLTSAPNLFSREELLDRMSEVQQ